MVAMLCAPEAEIAERMALEAFVGGWASKDSYDVLVECHTMLTLGAVERKDESALAMARLASVALQNIRDRYAQTERFGISGDELAALREFVEFAQDWWKRQGGGLWERAYQATHRWHGMSASERERAAA